MRNKTLIAGSILILLVIAGIILSRNIQPRQNQPASQNPSAQQTYTTVSFDNSGFVPKEVRIKAGERVVWTNNSASTANVSSNDHPTHQKYTPLNLGNIPPNFSVDHVFNKKGTYSYHNHLNPSLGGTVIVE